MAPKGKLAQTAAERLGPVFLRLRTERRIPSTKLSQETGLTRSYLNYLERGRFKEIGIEKFAKLIQAMRVSADEVLGEIGYLPVKAKDRPSPEAYLQRRFKLSPEDTQAAIRFLEFLARRSRRPKEPEARRRR